LAAIAVGAGAGAGLPAGLRLEFVIPLFLVGEVVPRLSTRQARMAVGAALVASLLATPAPFQLGTLLAVLAGTTVGLRAEGRDP
jgi:hypothetical protein